MCNHTHHIANIFKNKESNFWHIRLSTFINNNKNKTHTGFLSFFFWVIFQHFWLFYSPAWNAATARKKNSGSRTLILTAGLVCRGFGMALLSLCGLLYKSSVTSHVLHGQAVLVPLSRPTWEDGLVVYHHTDVSLFSPSMPPIVWYLVTWSFIWDVWWKQNKKREKKEEGKKGTLCIRAETNVCFLLRMEMVISLSRLGLWMMSHNVARWDNSSINLTD